MRIVLIMQSQPSSQYDEMNLKALLSEIKGKGLQGLNIVACKSFFQAFNEQS